MASSSRSSLDEAHCLWPLCSHTCCWEAEQRINKGHHRRMKTLNSRGTSETAAEEDKLPVVTVVNASHWSDGSSLELLSLKSEDDFSEAANNVLISPVALPRRARRQEDVQIKNSGVDVSTHLEMSRENEAVKLKTVHIRPLSTDTSMSSKPILMWISSSSCIPLNDSSHSAEPPQLAVRELIFPPSAETNTSVGNKKELKQDKSRERIFLKKTPLKSTVNQEGKGSLKWEAGTDLPDPGSPWRGSDSDLQVKKTSALPQVARLVPVGQTLAAAPEAKDEQQPPRSAQTLLPRNKPMVLERVWERMQGRHTQDRHRMSKYKRDLKTGLDLPDCESLKRQTYLWRKHT